VVEHPVQGRADLADLGAVVGVTLGDVVPATGGDTQIVLPPPASKNGTCPWIEAGTDGSVATLLAYAITTDPDPLQASPSRGTPPTVALTIVVPNNTSEPIFCEQIQFGFPVGMFAQSLTVVTTHVSWTVDVFSTVSKPTG
jgi:hypothetical protein